MTFVQEELYREAREAHQRGDLVKAGSLYTRFVSLNPGAIEAWEALAAILVELGNLEGAAECLTGILRFAPDYPDRHRMHAQLAWIYNVQGRAEAVAQAREAVRLDPGYEAGWHSLAAALERAGQYDEAVACCDRLEAMGSTKHREALHSMKRAICAFDGVEALEAALADQPAVALNLGHLAMLGTTPQRQLELARAQSQRYPARYMHPPGAAHQVRDRRIRLGYIGNEFHNTPTMVCLASTLENHDRDRFELHCFSFGPENDDPFRQRAKAASYRFHEVRGLPGEAIARLIKQIGIDILIDLCGYIRDHRVEVLARRPAPVQIGYIGWPATMGAPFLDHLVADKVVAQDPALFDEKLLLLDCYLPTDDRKAEPKTPPRSELGLPQDALVLAGMNNAWKITPQMMRTWCEILAELPDAVLWQVARREDVERNLTEFARSFGVADRIIFAKDVAYEAHLNRLGAADLAVDTFPYNGHSTTSDLLFAGVPVVTLRGETFASRVATSLLTATGLPELSTASLAEYKALILGLGRDRPRLAALKARLNTTRSTSPLFDNKRYTKALEEKLIALVS